MELLQLIDTGLHVAAIAYILSLLFVFASGLPKPRPVRAATTVSRPHTQKKPCENALEPPQNQFQVQMYQQREKQPVMPNYAELSLKQLRAECKRRGINPSGDMRKKSAWIDALTLAVNTQRV